MVENSKALQKRQQQEYMARLGDYLKTFTSPHGRRVLKDMRRSYCGSIEEIEMAKIGIALGKRNVVKEIEAIILTGKNPQAVEDLFRSPEDDGFEL